MKKKWIFYSIVAAFGVLFLTLPLIFDIEEPVSSEAEYFEPGEALSFNPETGEVLPSARESKSKQTKQPSNFFKRYAQKLGNFYKEGFNILTASARQAPPAVYDDGYDFLFYSANAADAYGYEYGGGDYAHYYVRQTPSGDVPVKGIHEISLTDTDRPEARQIHTRIMNRVNHAAPAAQPAPPQRDYTPGKTAAAATDEKPSLLAYATITGLGSQGFIERYTGISPKQQGPSGGGTISGFDSGPRRATQGDLEGFRPANFESEAKRLEAEAAQIASGGDGGGANSGIISAVRETLKDIFTNAQNQGAGQGGQGHNHGGGHNHGQGENPGEPPFPLFNPDAWITNGIEHPEGNCNGGEPPAPPPGQQPQWLPSYYCPLLAEFSDRLPKKEDGFTPVLTQIFNIMGCTDKSCETLRLTAEDSQQKKIFTQLDFVPFTGTIATSEWLKIAAGENVVSLIPQNSNIPCPNSMCISTKDNQFDSPESTEEAVNNIVAQYKKKINEKQNQPEKS